MPLGVCTSGSLLLSKRNFKNFFILGGMEKNLTFQFDVKRSKRKLLWLMKLLSSTYISFSVGSGPEIFGLGLTGLPNVRARALSGLVKCEIFGLGL